MDCSASHLRLHRPDIDGLVGLDRRDAPVGFRRRTFPTSEEPNDHKDHQSDGGQEQCRREQRAEVVGHLLHEGGLLLGSSRCPERFFPDLIPLTHESDYA